MKMLRRQILAWVLFGATLLLFGIYLLIAFVISSSRDWSELAFNIVTLAFLCIGTLVALRKPDNPIGWSLGLFAFAGTFAPAAMEYGRLAMSRSPRLPLAGLAGALDGAVGDWLAPVFFIFTFLFFPDGRLPSPRWRWFLYAVLLTYGVGFMAILLRSGIGLRVAADNPIGIPGTHEAFTFIKDAAAAIQLPLIFFLLGSLVVRRRRASPVERQQLKWLFFTASLIAVTFVMIGINEFTGSDWGDQYGEFIWFGILILVVASIAIAVLKYRLYDIDVVINKTIVFGVLAAFITGIYVAIVVGIGTLLGSQDEPNLALSIAATAIVAIAFSPVKERTQRLANRLVYGQRVSPYEVLADLSRTVAIAPTPTDVLEGVARAAATGMNAHSAVVSLLLDEGNDFTVKFPVDGDEARGEEHSRFIAHRNEVLGTLIVTKRPRDPFTSHDRDLIEDLSSQAGLALHNARLAIDLQARLDQISAQAEELRSSRARIVSASDDSRRRLEREITEGPRKDLVSIQGELQRAHVLMDSDPEAATALLEGLPARANETLDALRELARGIYPPLLADKGIVAALEAHIRKNDLPVSLDPGDADAVRFNESIETTVYFCCVEGLAGTTELGRTVGLSISLVGDQLHFSIESVASEEVRAAIRDRVEAVGGSIADGSHGDIIEASLPSRIMEPAS
jgi:signal transduction histidine kinase